MIQLIKTISNPLTIIAIFAALAETFGTVTIQFMDPSIQMIFVWFLVGFPTLLLVLFFLTLNFNREALYAPTDYKNEENFMLARIKRQAVDSELQVMRYELERVTDVLADKTTPANEMIASVTEKLDELQERVAELQNSARDEFGALQYQPMSYNALTSRLVHNPFRSEGGDALAIMLALQQQPDTIEGLARRTRLRRRFIVEQLDELMRRGDVIVAVDDEIGGNVYSVPKTAHIPLRPPQPLAP